MGSIVVQGIGKSYRQYASRWGRLLEWVLPFSRPRHTLHPVLKNISFQVAPGEAVAIVGVNGAGKSTLLKLITGTTQPTTGTISMSGRVASLLELGIGFHPDFTGRQNLFMSGQLLGLDTATINRNMESILEFAEIGEYVDQPVRVYSSGMQMRLAFSLATAVRPDILIVDEALSVGDTYFQHKSFDRIKKFREMGTTLLIVSHDKQAIQNVCSRAILLNNGVIAMEGEPEMVMNYYNALLAEKELPAAEVINEETRQLRHGSGEVSLTNLRLEDEDTGQPLENISVGQKIRLKATVNVYQEVEQLVFGFCIKDRVGQDIFGTNTFHTRQVLQNLKPGQRIEYDIGMTMNLGPGSYSIQTALVNSDTHLDQNYDWQDRALIFTILNSNKTFFIGSTWLPVKVDIQQT